jgi:predicted XRE-type DNA-binding protein
MSDLEMTVTPGSGNVYADLGFENPEEELLKARIVMHLQTLITDRGLNQTAAGELLGLKQPDVSKLLRGRFGGYSIERLLRFVRIMGEDVTITVRSPKQPSEKRDIGNLSLLVA